MNHCQYCNNYIDILEYHSNTCIYFVYYTNFVKNIPKIEIEKICKLTNLFNLHKYSNTTIFDIDSIINMLIVKNCINSEPIILELINFIQTTYNNKLSYNDILNIIHIISNHSILDINNIIYSYKYCYSNL